MADLNSLRWVELGVIAPGRSHYWLFDPLWNADGSVFHATAYPESFSLEQDLAARRVEVTELFIIRKNSGLRDRKCQNQINITVTNTGADWVPYTLWVAAIPPARRRPGADTRRAADVLPAAAAEGANHGLDKVLVIHDEDGNIESAAFPAGTSNVRAGLRPQRDGELVTEAEAIGLELEQIRRSPRHIVENLRLDIAHARLVAKYR
jgi:hypothetical protein